MTHYTIETLRNQYADAIVAVMDKYGADQVRVFGSVARGEAEQESDVDFLVHLRPKTTLLHLAALHRELGQLLGCKVDIISERAINTHIREGILKDAVLL